MATVYAGHDTVLDRSVAVKILREQFAADPVFLTRFTHEALHASNLSHPGVATVFDAGVDESTAFIVMERVYGPTLREVLRSQGPLPVDQAVMIAASVCDVLAAAHRAGIVHRDIKPANIVLAVDGRVRVLDFGIAHKQGSDPLTQTATVMGTAAYLSPEQAAGRPAEPASDLYSVGCVLMEMLTGSPPFDAETPMSALYRHVHDLPARAGAVRPEVSQALDDVLARLLAKEPDRRPATAEAARDQLLATLPGSLPATQVMPVVAPDPTQGLPRRRRHTAVAVIAAAALVVVASFVALGLGQRLGGSDARSSTPLAGPTAAKSLTATPVVHPATPTASLAPSPSLTVTRATSFTSALDAARAVIRDGQTAHLIDPAAAGQLLDAVNALGRSSDQRHGKSTQSRIGDLTDLVGRLSAQGLITGDAVTALDQAVAQLYGWPTGSGEA
jgi:serine/threonine protein kinase